MLNRNQCDPLLGDRARVQMVLCGTHAGPLRACAWAKTGWGLALNMWEAAIEKRALMALLCAGEGGVSCTDWGG